MKALIVEWMDGRKDVYAAEGCYTKDEVLIVTESPTYGRTRVLASIPIVNLRQWTWGDGSA